MDWIHCNNCYSQLVEGISFNLTSCGHMFCSKCLNPGAVDWKCKLCGSICKTMQLEPNMSSEVQDFFSEPEEIINRLSQVIDFQKKHRIRLTSYWMNLTKKYQSAREEIKRLNDLGHKMNVALKEANRQIKNLKSKLAVQSGGTPSMYASPMAIAQQQQKCGSSRYSQSTRDLIPIPTLQVTMPPSNQFSQVYQSNLVTPDRLSRQRNTGYLSGGSQTNRSHILSPHSQGSIGSNYSTASSMAVSPQVIPQKQSWLPPQKKQAPKTFIKKSKETPMPDQFNRMHQNKSQF